MALHVLLALVCIVSAAMLQCGCSALLASRRGRLESEAKRGLYGAKEALLLIDRSEEVRNTARITTLAMVVAASLLGGPTIERECSNLLATITGSAADPSALSLLLAILVAGVLSVLAAEIVPHLLASRSPEVCSRYLSFTVSRVVSFFSPIHRALHALFGQRYGESHGEEHDSQLEDDIRDLVAEGKKAGIIEAGEQDIINRVFALDDKPVSSIMTVRADVHFLRSAHQVSDLLLKAAEGRHSWFPVVGESEDEVLGIISVHDLVVLAREQSCGTERLRAFMREPLQVPESMSSLKLLERFRDTGTRFGVVRDEYGGVAGVVTMYDVLQVIVGERGGLDLSTGEVIERGDGSFLVDARSDVHDLFESLGIEREEDGRSGGEFRSLGGFVMTTLGYVPKEGERFEAFGYNFEVVDMDNKRIDKVLVWRSPVQKVVSA